MTDVVDNSSISHSMQTHYLPLCKYEQYKQAGLTQWTHPYCAHLSKGLVPSGKRYEAWAKNLIQNFQKKHRLFSGNFVLVCKDSFVVTSAAWSHFVRFIRNISFLQKEGIRMARYKANFRKFVGENGKRLVKPQYFMCFLYVFASCFCKVTAGYVSCDTGTNFANDTKLL